MGKGVQRAGGGRPEPHWLVKSVPGVIAHKES